MSGMTHGAREPGVDVERVLGEAGVGHNVVQVVTLGTQGIRSVCAGIGDGRKKIQDGASRTGGGRKAGRYLAELVTAFQNMRKLGTVRSTRSSTAKFPIIVAVVAVRAENALSDWTPLGAAVQIPHELEQAGLGQSTPS